MTQYEFVNLLYDNYFDQYSHLYLVTKERLKKLIGQHIKELRTEKGWSQVDLARACGKDRQAIEKLENGKVNPTIYSLLEIANALEVPLTTIVDI